MRLNKLSKILESGNHNLFLSSILRELGLNKQYLTGTQRGQARIEDGTDAVISLLRSAVLRFGFRVLVYNFPGLEESDITREQIEEQRKKIETK